MANFSRFQDLPSWVYDTDNYDPHPPQELVCSICHSVLRDPLQSPCNHTFCCSCIYQWLEGNATCPICRRNLSFETVVDANPKIKSQINSLRLRCPHAKRGCASKFPLQKYYFHLRSCEFEPLTEVENQKVVPNEVFVTRLLKASRDRSLHHLMPKILNTEKESINVGSKFQETPLLVALKQGCSLETLTVLLEAGAEVSAKDQWGSNALHSALGRCPRLVIRKLIHSNKEMVHEKDSNGMNALMFALSTRCSLAVFHELMKAGPDLAVSTHDSWTALHFAAKGGCSKEILQEMIRRQPDLMGRRNKWGCIPLHWAKDDYVLRTLLEAGSDAGARDEDGNTPLQRAVIRKEVTSSRFQIYLSHMSIEQLQQVNNKGENLFHAVCMEGRDKENKSSQTHHEVKNSERVCKSDFEAKLVQKLLKLGVDPTRKNEQGETALHLSAYRGDFELCKELIRGHANLVEIKNNEGKTAIEVSNIEIAKEMAKWISLQDVRLAKRVIRTMQDPSNRKHLTVFLEKCQWDLKLLQQRRVSNGARTFTLKRLLLDLYLIEGENWEEVRQLYPIRQVNFDSILRRLSVFRQEVLEIQKQALGESDDTDVTASM